MKTIAVLMGIEKPVNLGLVARLVDNFEAELRLVDVRLSEEGWRTAEVFASHSRDAVRGSLVYDTLEEAIVDAELVVATSSKRSHRGSNILRRALDLKGLEEILHGRGLSRIAVVFGRESRGLSNEEIGKCDLLLRIEASGSYGTLNVACAAAILLHHLYTMRECGAERHAANGLLRGRVVKQFERLASLVVTHPDKAGMAVRAFSNLTHRGLPDDREATLILGILRRSSLFLEETFKDISRGESMVKAGLD